MPDRTLALMATVLLSGNISTTQPSQPQNRCLDGFPYSREEFREKFLNLANDANAQNVVASFKRDFDARRIGNNITPASSSTWVSLKHCDWYVPVDIGSYNDLLDKQIVHIFVYFNTLQPPRAIKFAEEGQSQCIDAPLLGRWMKDAGWVGGEQKFDQNVYLAYRKLDTSIEAQVAAPLRPSDLLPCISSLQITFRKERR
jgi:hypothetical protein